MTRGQIKQVVKGVSIALGIIGLSIIFKTSPIAVVLIIVGMVGFYFAERA